ncbi:hypothetical protein LFL97_20055 [Burkholderia sp. JSH-S8]|nr:hypothetical protein LFL97_20055 [Burkholderia sp. JSH-S8]
MSNRHSIPPVDRDASVWPTTFGHTMIVGAPSAGKTALIVYGDTPEAAISNGAYVTSRTLNDCGFKFVKATASAPYTYMSQVPGFTTKPRPMPKSTRSLASSFSMHTSHLFGRQGAR